MLFRRRNLGVSSSNGVILKKEKKMFLQWVVSRGLVRGVLVQ